MISEGTIQMGMVILVLLALAFASGTILWSTEPYELIAIGLIVLGGIYLTR